MKEITTGNSPKIIRYSKKKRTHDDMIDKFIFPDDFCQEIWITNIKLTNILKPKVHSKQKSEQVKREKPRLFLIELHCYTGYCMLKFYPKSLKQNPNKFKLRGEQIDSNIHFSEVRS